jgi:hypothetical protein
MTAMGKEEALTGEELRTPRSPATAGMLFGMLLITSQLLVRISVPLIPQRQR